MSKRERMKRTWSEEEEEEVVVLEVVVEDAEVVLELDLEVVDPGDRIPEMMPAIKSVVAEVAGVSGVFLSFGVGCGGVAGVGVVSKKIKENK